MSDLKEFIKPKKHPKCLGIYGWSPDGDDFECGYETTIECDECKYCTGAGGRKDPEAKCNQI